MPKDNDLLKTMEVITSQREELSDITDKVEEIIRKTGIKSGILPLVCCPYYSRVDH